MPTIETDGRTKIDNYDAQLVAEHDLGTGWKVRAYLLAQPVDVIQFQLVRPDGTLRKLVSDDAKILFSMQGKR
jgi:hypothetical protein